MYFSIYRGRFLRSKYFFSTPRELFYFFVGFSIFDHGPFFKISDTCLRSRGFLSSNFRKITITLFSIKIKIVAHFYFYHSGIPSLPIADHFWIFANLSFLEILHFYKKLKINKNLNSFLIKINLKITYTHTPTPLFNPSVTKYIYITTHFLLLCNLF